MKWSRLSAAVAPTSTRLSGSAVTGLLTVSPTRSMALIARFCRAGGRSRSAYGRNEAIFSGMTATDASAWAIRLGAKTAVGRPMIRKIAV